jgi:decaprenyl-phosphate phosphoribosyltransferase
MTLSLLAALRPGQWIKNFLVAAAPIAAGVIQKELISVVIGIFGFIFASSFGYLINDWVDRKSDKIHETKKSRPFASGVLGLKHLILMSIVCLVGIFFSCFYLNIKYAIVLGLYVFITISYSIFLKHQPVIEMFWLASGFLVRAIAGSVIIGYPPTGWFVLSVFFGSLLIVSAKRLAELQASYSSQTRKVLEVYSVEFLRLIVAVSLGTTLITYSLWVFQVHPNSLIAQISIIPFSLTLFTFSFQCEKGDAQSPEILLFTTRSLLIPALLSIFCLAVVFYK